eukprot:5023935-Prymnesium_polylepis.1
MKRALARSLARLEAALEGIIPADSGSQKVQQPFQRFQAHIKLMSRTIECIPGNASDLERAPGARSIGDEFS